MFVCKQKIAIAVMYYYMVIPDFSNDTLLYIQFIPEGRGFFSQVLRRPEQEEAADNYERNDFADFEMTEVKEPNGAPMTPSVNRSVSKDKTERERSKQEYIRKAQGLVDDSNRVTTTTTTNNRMWKKTKTDSHISFVLSFFVSIFFNSSIQYTSKGAAQARLQTFKPRCLSLHAPSSHFVRGTKNRLFFIWVCAD